MKVWRLGFRIHLIMQKYGFPWHAMLGFLVEYKKRKIEDVWHRYFTTSMLIEDTDMFRREQHIGLSGPGGWFNRKMSSYQ